MFSFISSVFLFFLLLPFLLNSKPIRDDSEKQKEKSTDFDNDKYLQCNLHYIRNMNKKKIEKFFNENDEKNKMENDMQLYNRRFAIRASFLSSFHCMFNFNFRFFFAFCFFSFISFIFIFKLHFVCRFDALVDSL